MNYNTIEKLVSERTGEEVTIQLCPKGNHMYHGIIIGSGVIRPTIYLECMRGETDEEIAKNVVSAYDNREKSIPDFDTHDFDDWETAKAKIIPCLELTGHRIDSTVVTMPFLGDMDMYFRYVVEYSKKGLSSIVIQSPHLTMWGQDAEELRKIAVSNLEKDGDIVIHDLNDMLNSMLAEKGLEDEMDENDPLKLLAVTNRRFIFGANLLASDRTLKKVREMVESDYYVIPSSVNEFLVVPCSDDMTPDYLRQIIGEVNRNQVPEDEWLSNNVYLFTKDGLSVA
jgi:hypothetical protein